MRRSAEDLDTDVVGSRLQMLLHTSANRFNVTPRNECIYQPVAALPHEVVVGESEATPVVGIVRQVEVSGDVPSSDRSSLVRVCLQDHGLFRQEPAVGAESCTSLCCVLRCDEVGMSALGSLGGQGEHPGSKRSQYARWRLSALDAGSTCRPHGCFELLGLVLEDR